MLTNSHPPSFVLQQTEQKSCLCQIMYKTRSHQQTERAEHHFRQTQSVLWIFVKEQGAFREEMIEDKQMKT